MKFRNPRGDQFIEGRIPREEDHFSDDRYYTDLERIFVRFDPYKDHVRVTFPCSSEIVLKFSYDSLAKVAKTNPTLKEFVLSADNVEDISDEYFYGYRSFDDDNKWYVKLKNLGD